MNGDSPHGGQPWSVDLLADLHADGGDRSGLDADALAVLAALDATQAELASLPPMRMPDDVAARLDAALAAEAAARSDATPPHGIPLAAVPPPVPLRPAAGPMTPPQRPIAPVVNLADARRRRNRLLGIAGGVVTAAAVAIGIVVVTVPGGDTAGTPQAIPNTSIQTDPHNGPLALHSTDLPGAGVKALGAQDYGPFADAGRLSACLTANGLDGAAKPLFGRQATVDGKPAEMLLLPTGKAARYQLLVVGTDCAAGKPSTLANSTIGG